MKASKRLRNIHNIDQYIHNIDQYIDLLKKNPIRNIDFFGPCTK